MAERAKPALIKVDCRGPDRRISICQKRQPHLVPAEGQPLWSSVDRRPTYPPMPECFLEAYTFSVEYWSEDGIDWLNIPYRAGRGRGSTGSLGGYILGTEMNQLDIRMWNVPEDTPVESDVYDQTSLQYDRGELSHEGEVFDRRIIVPIPAGTTSLHLTTKDPAFA